MVRKFVSLFLLFLPVIFASAQVVALKEPIRFLALGDSYTIGESVSEPERWPNQLKDSLLLRNYQVDTSHIIATTGWTTGNLLNAISTQNLQADGYNLVGLLIGVNNQFQGQSITNYRAEFQQLLDSALLYAGQDSNSVFVVSIPDYAFTPFGQGSGNAAGISAGVDLFNQVNDSITAAYGIKYFNITHISREGVMDPTLVASDGLHPSGSQYTRWVELMLAHLDNLGNTSVALPQKKSELKLYPIPSTRSVFLEGLEGEEKVEIQVLDLRGQIVLTQTNMAASPLELDLKLPSGHYFLIVKGHANSPIPFLVE